MVVIVVVRMEGKRFVKISNIPEKSKKSSSFSVERVFTINSNRRVGFFLETKCGPLLKCVILIERESWTLLQPNWTRPAIYSNKIININLHGNDWKWWKYFFLFKYHYRIESTLNFQKKKIAKKKSMRLFWLQMISINPHWEKGEGGIYDKYTLCVQISLQCNNLSPLTMFSTRLIRVEQCRYCLGNEQNEARNYWNILSIFYLSNTICAHLKKTHLKNKRKTVGQLVFSVEFNNIVVNIKSHSLVIWCFVGVFCLTKNVSKLTNLRFGEAKKQYLCRTRPLTMLAWFTFDNSNEKNCSTSKNLSISRVKCADISTFLYNNRWWKK